MRFAKFMPALSLLLLAALSTSTAAQSNRNKPAPITPNPTKIAVYIPPSMLSERSYLQRINLWVEPGKALENALADIGKRYFPDLITVPGKEDDGYALLVDLSPKWGVESGKIKLTLGHDVYTPDGEKLFEGTTSQTAPLRGFNFNAATQAAATLAIQQTMARIQDKLDQTPGPYPVDGHTQAIDYAPLVDREKPLRTGTAFFINKAGQLLTAAHVSRDCMVLEAHLDGATLPVTQKASSALLDIAVLETGQPRDSALGLRQGYNIELGESISSVGYPLSGLLGDSPNLTRGNISANKGLRGSMGMFQFSAPIQPGNSGGPIVSDHGELLGMSVSTLNASSLAEMGHIPQNINFALDARHVARFMEREGIPFELVKPQSEGSMQTANRAALSNTVQLNCYQ